MKLFKHLILPLVIVLVALLAAKWMISRRSAPDKKEPEVQALLVETVVIHPTLTALPVLSQGMVEPRTRVELTLEVAGRILETSSQWHVGGFFRKGDLLLKLDDTDYRTALADAEAQLQDRLLALEEETARARQAKRDLERLGTPDADPLAYRQPQLDRAKAQAQAARARVEKARRDMERTRLHAPFDGLLQARRADLGQFAQPGMAVGTLAAVDQAEIRLPLTRLDRDFLELPKVSGNAFGPEVTLTVVRTEGEGEPISWKARIVRTEGVVDVQTRLLYAVALLEDPYALSTRLGEPPLPLGTFVRGRIEGMAREQVVQIPQHAMRGLDQVLVVTPDQTIEVRPVRLLRMDRENAYIQGDLPAGTRLCTTAVLTMLPGTRVRFQEESSKEVPAP